MAQQHSDTFIKLQNVVAEVTGEEPTYVTPDLSLDELLIEDFASVIRKVNTTFHIHLHPKSVMLECETMEELSELIDEETKFG